MLGESNDQWQLRRKFIMKHIDTMPQRKLLPLSQVFANRYYLQCTYSPSLIKLVSEMGDDLLPAKRVERLIERPKSNSFKEKPKKKRRAKVTAKDDAVFSDSDSGEAVPIGRLFTYKLI